MEEVNRVFAENLLYLRKTIKLTQAELAEKLNYSDKAISKWERGEALPDAATLLNIAQLFGITVDELIAVNLTKKTSPAFLRKVITHNHLMIASIAVLSVWVAAVLCFVVLTHLLNNSTWLCFIYAIPVSAVVTIVFNGVWGKSKLITFAAVSVLIWSLLLCIFLTFAAYVSAWIFLIGVPAELILLFACRIIVIKKMDGENDGSEKNS